MELTLNPQRLRTAAVEIFDNVTEFMCYTDALSLDNQWRDAREDNAVRLRFERTLKLHGVNPNGHLAFEAAMPDAPLTYEGRLHSRPIDYGGLMVGTWAPTTDAKDCKREVRVWFLLLLAESGVLAR